MAETTPLTRTAHFEMSHDTYTAGTVRGHELWSDEPTPIGDNAHPSPVDYLVTSLTTCQMAVLSFCLEKARIDHYTIDAEAETTEELVGEVANEMPNSTQKRVTHIDINLDLEVAKKDAERARRCLQAYDSGCVVGQSIKAGVDYDTSTSLTIAD